VQQQRDSTFEGRLAGKVIFLAGATSGIGRTIAEVFAEEGASVIVGGRRRPQGEAIAQAISRGGGTAVYEPLDVTDEASVADAVQNTVGRFGRLDVLVSNAGGSAAADGPVTTASLSEFWQKIRVDLLGTFLCSRLAIPEMIRSGGGSLINMASLAGFGTTVGRDAYTSAKGGVISLTKSTAREFATHNVRVNAIAPAGVRTDRIERLIATVPEAREVVQRQTFGLIEPREIAYAAVFLASDESRSITGQILTVNGGLFD